MEDIREMIERNKIKAEAFLKENKRAFIVDINNEWFFCDIINSDDIKIIIKPFAGNHKDEKIERYWADIIKFDAYEDRGYSY